MLKLNQSLPKWSHNMTSRLSFHEMLSQKTRVPSNLVGSQEGEASQISGNNNFVQSISWKL